MKTVRRFPMKFEVNGEYRGFVTTDKVPKGSTFLGIEYLEDGMPYAVCEILPEKGAAQ